MQETDPRVDTAIDSIDLAIAELMRDILHHREFQGLESSWRSLFDMVTELELDENLHLYVCSVSRDELLSNVWGEDVYTTSRTVDNFILKLRQKIEDNPNQPKKIITIHGIGYKLLA